MVAPGCGGVSDEQGTPIVRTKAAFSVGSLEERVAAEEGPHTVNDSTLFETLVQTRPEAS